jgi:hypothetical protein
MFHFFRKEVEQVGRAGCHLCNNQHAHLSQGLDAAEIDLEQGKDTKAKSAGAAFDSMANSRAD